MSKDYDALIKAARAARKEGFAVIIWTPEEVGDADPEELEDVSISFGSDWLEAQKTPELSRVIME